MVVEAPDGTIVRTWMLMTVAHAEGAWAHPDHRKKPGAARAMWMTMRETARQMGISGVVTAALAPDVDELITGHGGNLLEGRHYTMRLDAREQRRDRTRGRRFHDALLAAVPDSIPHDEPAHYLAIGRALRVAIDEHDPVRAEAEYNAWSQAAGYEPVTFQGMRDDGALLVEMGKVLVAIGPVLECEVVSCQ